MKKGEGQFGIRRSHGFDKLTTGFGMKRRKPKEEAERHNLSEHLFIFFSLCHFEQSGATPRNLAVCCPPLHEPLSFTYGLAPQDPSTEVGMKKEQRDEKWKKGEKSEASFLSV